MKLKGIPLVLSYNVGTRSKSEKPQTNSCIMLLSSYMVSGFGYFWRSGLTCCSDRLVVIDTFQVGFAGIFKEHECIQVETLRQRQHL